MTTPSPNTALPPPKPFSRPFNPRTAGMLLGFAVVICATVILTDSLSPRDRHPAVVATTAPATGR